VCLYFQFYFGSDFTFLQIWKRCDGLLELLYHHEEVLFFIMARHGFIHAEPEHVLDALAGSAVVVADGFDSRLKLLMGSIGSNLD